MTPMPKPKPKIVSSHLVKKVDHIVALCKNGQILLNQQDFCRGLPLYAVKVIGLAAADVKPTPQKPRPRQAPRLMTLDVMDAHDETTAATIACSSDFSQSIDIYASDLGRKYCGEFGVRMRNLDTKLRSLERSLGDVKEDGLSTLTRGRWGLNVSQLPWGERTLVTLKLGPFPPPDGIYILRLCYWNIIDATLDDETRSLVCKTYTDGYEASEAEAAAAAAEVAK